MTNYKVEKMNKYIKTTDWMIAMYGLAFYAVVAIGAINSAVAIGALDAY